ncbi:hypothetical protein DPMN_153681 [Dreissena polymorpha]|uniref:Uncharacterized protein n=1 Tax=Dreissena polymorpha TaxID=45954 RepID=A0A9D4FL87_DREPO|nr:hypothetical protein DPMN_153681 [Dreissena polymorpha]
MRIQRPQRSMRTSAGYQATSEEVDTNNPGNHVSYFRSNDAVNFCSPSKVVVLDGNCQDFFQDAAGNTVMILKPRYCYIEGRCVGEGTPGDDSCTECKPSSSTFEWTNGKSEFIIC